jgi:hypothetical protein
MEHHNERKNRTADRTNGFPYSFCTYENCDAQDFSVAGTLLIHSCNCVRFHHRLSFLSLMEEHRLNEQSDVLVTVLGRLPKLTVATTLILIGNFHSPSQSPR